MNSTGDGGRRDYLDYFKLSDETIGL